MNRFEKKLGTTLLFGVLLLFFLLGQACGKDDSKGESTTEVTTEATTQTEKSKEEPAPADTQQEATKPEPTQEKSPGGSEPTQETNTPDVNSPDAATPDATAPDATAPDAPVADATAPDAPTSQESTQPDSGPADEVVVPEPAPETPGESTSQPTEQIPEQMMDSPIKPTGPGTITGTFGGRKFGTILDALHFQVSGSFGLAIGDISSICNAINQPNPPAGNFTILSLQFTSVPKVGTYSFGTQLMGGIVSRRGTSMQQTRITSGTVTFTAVSTGKTGSVKGSFSAVTQGGDKLTGTFATTYCAKKP